MAIYSLIIGDLNFLRDEFYKMKLIIVEDDQEVAVSINRALFKNGYATDIAFDGDHAIELLEVNEYDMLILDLNLPDIDGLEVCQFARNKQPAILILILTARGRQEDIITGLDSGADDYLVKPFHLQEFLARIRALFRRDTHTITPIIKAQDISLDPIEKVVWKGQHRIQLTRKEFGILEYLMRHPNEVISQEELIEHVWHSSANPFSNTIRVHIRSLRDKLGDNSENSQYIATIIGTGYRFILNNENDITHEA